MRVVAKVRTWRWSWKDLVTDQVADEIEQKDKDASGWMNNGTEAGVQPVGTGTAILVVKILKYFHGSSLLTHLSASPLLLPPKAFGFPWNLQAQLCPAIP